MVVASGTILTGYTALASGAAAPANGVFIPLTAVPAWTPASVDEVTGSFAKMLFDLLEVCEVKYNALPPTSQSTRLALQRSYPVGAGNTLISVGITVTGTLDVSNADIAIES